MLRCTFHYTLPKKTRWLFVMSFYDCMWLLQTLEARNNYTTRATKILNAGAHFVETTFPTTPTLFPSTFTVRLLPTCNFHSECAERLYLYGLAIGTVFIALTQEKATSAHHL